jgi:hypothetical protein
MAISCVKTHANDINVFLTMRSLMLGELRDEEQIMTVGSISASAGAANLRAASAAAAASTAKSAEEQQEPATERQQEVGQGEESGSSAVQATQRASAPSVNLLV